MAAIRGPNGRFIKQAPADGQPVSKKKKTKKVSARISVSDEEKNALIASVEYSRPAGTMTLCTITMVCGWVFHGSSACVNPEEFNEELGKKYALEIATDRMIAAVLFHKQLTAYLAKKA